MREEQEINISPALGRMRNGARNLHGQQGGQILLFTALIIFTLVCFVALVVNVGTRVTGKIQVQNAADASVYSGATWMARGMNFSAILNVGHTQGLATIIFIKAFVKTTYYTALMIKVNLAAASSLTAVPIVGAAAAVWLNSLLIVNNWIYMPIGGKILIAENTKKISNLATKKIKAGMNVLSGVQEASAYIFPAIARYEANQIARMNKTDSFLGINAIFLPIWEQLPIKDGEFLDICYHTDKDKIPAAKKENYAYPDNPESKDASEPFFYGYETFLKWQKRKINWKNPLDISRKTGTADGMGMRVEPPFIGAAIREVKDKIPVVGKFIPTDFSINQVLSMYWIAHLPVLPPPYLAYEVFKDLSYYEVCDTDGSIFSAKEPIEMYEENYETCKSMYNSIAAHLKNKFKIEWEGVRYVSRRDHAIPPSYDTVVDDDSIVAFERNIIENYETREPLTENELKPTLNPDAEPKSGTYLLKRVSPFTSTSKQDYILKNGSKALILKWEATERCYEYDWEGDGTCKGYKKEMVFRKCCDVFDGSCNNPPAEEITTLNPTTGRWETKVICGQKEVEIITPGERKLYFYEFWNMVRCKYPCDTECIKKSFLTTEIEDPVKEIESIVEGVGEVKEIVEDTKDAIQTVADVAGAAQDAVDAVNKLPSDLDSISDISSSLDDLEAQLDKTEQYEFPKPKVLADGWEEKSVYSVIVFKDASGRGFWNPQYEARVADPSTGGAKQPRQLLRFGESAVDVSINKMWGTASAQVFCPSQPDLFNQDWHVRLVPFSIRRILPESVTNIIDYQQFQDVMAENNIDPEILGSFIPDFEQIADIMSH